MSTLTIVTKIARQVEGEYVFVSVLGAFKNIENVDPFVKKQKIKPTEVINNIPCIVEIGVIENVEILDE